MALEVKLGQDLRLRQQLVMTPQLQQAIKILQLSLPELEAVVQSELEQNPLLEPLDSSPSESQPAADAEPPASEEFSAPSEGDILSEDREPTSNTEDGPPVEWDPSTSVDQNMDGVHTVEAKDAALEQLDRFDKLDWREYMENYSNK